MKLSGLLDRAKNAWGRWSSALRTTGPAAGRGFALDEVTWRVEQLQPPQAPEPARIHGLIKLVPIPLPRTVRRESNLVYGLAWMGTALLAWAGWAMPPAWLWWYGPLAVLMFALLFRLEGPGTRQERLARQATVDWCRTRYHEAEQHLQQVLHERFDARLQDFRVLRHVYEAASQAIDAVEHSAASALYAPHETHGSWEQQLAADVDALESQMLTLVAELEGFSTLHKKEIDEAIVARHDARLAYWQARLDASVFTGEVVQSHW